MNYFKSRIYSLGTPYLLLNSRSTFFIFLVSHRSNEMAEKAFSTGLQTHRVNVYDYDHVTKLFLFASKVTNNTFHYNNYINFFYKYKSVLNTLYFKDYKLTRYSDFLYNVKQLHFYFHMFLKNTIPSFILWESWLNINKIKIFYISKIFLFFIINSIKFYKCYIESFKSYEVKI